MERKRNRYKEMERYMTYALLADAAVFVLYLHTFPPSITPPGIHCRSNLKSMICFVFRRAWPYC